MGARREVVSAVTERYRSAKRAEKAELEEDYGAYLTVENDAIVEKVDRETGKVGCSVTYGADIKGLAAKVLDEGATRRAKILIDQMSRQGASVERRVRYTVVCTENLIRVDDVMESPNLAG